MILCAKGKQHDDKYALNTFNNWMQRNKMMKWDYDYYQKLCKMGKMGKIGENMSLKRYYYFY